MEINDKGVMEPSYMDFTIPSDFARSALYCISQFGHFYCTPEYSVQRESLDLYLLVYVVNGSMSIETRGRKYAAFQDQIVLLDCHVPHKYCCRNSLDFLWFHFHGNSSRQYTEYLSSQYGIIFTGEHIPYLKQEFETLLSGAQSAIADEHLISLHVTRILSRLAVPETPAMRANHPLSPALQYISSHFHEEVDLNRMADLCSFSASHLIRIFKKYTGSTPHEYLLSYRLRQSKQLLLTSPRSVEQIAEVCGFNSASHFARAFKKQEGMTPSDFRKVQF
ncbi:AraC family transcriptional regulator [Ruminococcus sp. OA3]|uniref:AraC family transcriptional regulator n=1 Tax=Ruminococcus sp. OA3 TaxID=2914164 RepID=UPI001F05F9DD|nr:AraC family transcriptional regulator [Ruminococcus sp. OA3]MCH1981931.1 AraC family transcriptional regulator [Ruminococcus sp. OA3]